MSIEKLDFDDINEYDLQELHTAQVPEGLRIEYKQAMYGNSDGDKKELLKDVSAFANAQGGHLIIGIEENGGIPLNISGIDLQNPDQELLRLDQIIQNGLDPRITDIRTRSIHLQNGKYCVIIRVPRSWHPPHRVISGNSNRFYIRNDRNVSEPTTHELRLLFTKGADIQNLARQYQADRLENILSGQSGTPLVGGGRLIMHIIPFAALSSDFQINPRDIYSVWQNFKPFAASRSSPRYNFDGFIIERTGENNHGYTQIFRNGIIEVTKSPIVRTITSGQKIIGAKDFERYIFDKIKGYFDGLDLLNVPPPFIVLFTLEGVENAIYTPKPLENYDDIPPSIDRNTLYLPPCIINDYGSFEDYNKLLKPVFDALWNTTGYAEAFTFDENGVWNGRDNSR